MKALNLYILSRYTDARSYTEYYRAMADSGKAKRYSREEIGSLVRFVDILLDAGAGPALFENYFYGFEIPQIGKEFDILKIGEDLVLNIELKSRLDVQKAKAQLLKNRFYLRHLSGRRQSFVSFDASSGAFYVLDGEEFRPAETEEVLGLMEEAEEGIGERIEELFSVSRFLVSPLNTPERFLAGEYFLNLQQQEIKDGIVGKIARGQGRYYAISGSAGTGKTLLLYDIAKTLSERGKVCLIHCGQLSEGHTAIDGACGAIDVFPASRLRTQFDTEEYRYVMIDEAQRIYKEQLEDLLGQLAPDTPVVFSFDPRQTLTRTESNDDIPALIGGLEGIERFELTGKVRTNPELAAFIAGMGNTGKVNRNYSYRNVDLLYANSEEEAENMICLYQERGYRFINHTPSQYGTATLDRFDKSTVAHGVIGQEFDDVLVMLDDNFYYEGGKLRSKEHPNPNYLYHQMLFQEVTRVRERLAVLVLDNPGVFAQLMKLKTARKTGEN